MGNRRRRQEKAASWQLLKVPLRQMCLMFDCCFQTRSVFCLLSSILGCLERIHTGALILDHVLPEEKNEVLLRWSGRKQQRLNLQALGDVASLSQQISLAAMRKTLLVSLKHSHFQSSEKHWRKYPIQMPDLLRKLCLPTSLKAQLQLTMIFLIPSVSRD